MPPELETPRDSSDRQTLDDVLHVLTKVILFII